MPCKLFVFTPPHSFRSVNLQMAECKITLLSVFLPLQKAIYREVGVVFIWEH